MRKNYSPALSQEERLLLICSRLSLTPEFTNELRKLIRSPLDWNLLLRRAEEEGVAPLLYHKLKSEGMPDKAAASLKVLYFRTKRANEFTLRAFGEIGSILRGKGIEFILLQGISLIGTTYPEPGLRPLGDVDLLVKETDSQKVSSVINELGFKRAGRYSHLFTDGELLLDIHQELGNVSRIRTRGLALGFDMDEVWAKAVTKEGPFPYAYYLPAEYEFLYLASHLQRHSFSRLIWFVDLSELFRLKALDLDLLKDLAERTNLKRGLLFSLGFIKMHLNPAVPVEFIHSLEKPPFGFIEEMGYKKVLSFSPPPYFGDILFLLSIKGFRNRIRFGWETAFPRMKVMREMSSLPPGLFFLAYPLRLIKIFLMLLSLGASFLKKKA